MATKSATRPTRAETPASGRSRGDRRDTSVGAFLAGFVPGALAPLVAGYVLLSPGLGGAAPVVALVVLAVLAAMAFGSWHIWSDDRARNAGALVGLFAGLAAGVAYLWRALNELGGG